MSAAIEPGKVEIAVAAGIGRITFSHPKANSLPSALLRQIAEGIQQLSKDPETKVIVLLGAGEKSFCAGASFEELAQLKTIEAATEFFLGFARVIQAMRSAPKFIIARVHGKAVGGGVGLIAAADYAIATEGAELRLSEFEIGLGPFVIGPAVERKVGVAHFSAMAIDCSWRGADWALQHGLFQTVCRDIPELDRKVQEFALELSNRNPAATAALKQALWTGTDHWPQLLADRARTSATLGIAKIGAN